MSWRSMERAGTEKLLYIQHKGLITQVTASKARQSRLKALDILQCRDRPELLAAYQEGFAKPDIHFNSVEGMNFRMAQDRGTGFKEITSPTSQLINGFVTRHAHT
ncbi:hypothetical protein TNCV_1010941 [Trichonephila clavipes]|uniref:Uncharacterized protein n=1 Tax=Trichonephila clavipes TaxID=2585209 RepID=A0A8X6VX82_TRICX|nr:hypothetical protein TNCV_1010941 [Trichonephila clavipes]